jgi:(p)ppGpp synthase/HD superfamily hydrolase
MLGQAIALASKKFENKKDKGGKPYMLHCLRVMFAVKHLGEEVMCMAVLHDIVEDTDITILDLMTMGYSNRIIEGVSSLTHPKNTEYQVYIKSIVFNLDAVEVKKADLRDNSDILRLKGLTKKDFDRMEKYHRAYTYLSKI